MDSNILKGGYVSQFAIKQRLITDNTLIVCNTVRGYIYDIPLKYAGAISWLEPYIVPFADLCIFFDSIISGNSFITDTNFSLSRLDTLQIQISAVLFNVVCDRDWEFTDVLMWYMHRKEHILIVENLIQNKTVKVSVKNNRMLIVDI